MIGRENFPMYRAGSERRQRVFRERSCKLNETDVQNAKVPLILARADLILCEGAASGSFAFYHQLSVSRTKENNMKIWMKPQMREQEVGLEVTSYLPAEIDVI